VVSTPCSASISAFALDQLHLRIGPRDDDAAAQFDVQILAHTRRQRLPEAKRLFQETQAWSVGGAQSSP
jgi:hypothetical protein